MDWANSATAEELDADPERFERARKAHEEIKDLNILRNLSRFRPDADDVIWDVNPGLAEKYLGNGGRVQEVIDEYERLKREHDAAREERSLEDDEPDRYDDE